MLQIPVKDPQQLSPSVLAYVGDAVFELFVRTVLIDKCSGSVDTIHNHAVSFVKAESQARLLRGLEEFLTVEEKAVVRRGRNSKAGHVPKNASVVEYRYSTALESVIGYLYLSGKHARLEEIFEILKERIFNGGEDFNAGGAD